MALGCGAMAPPAPHPGHVIRTRRETLGLSQAELARRSGIGLRTIRRVEAAQGSPDSRTITRLRHTLGLPIDGAPAGLGVDEARREEIVAWFGDEATDMEWIQALARRLGRTGRQPVVLPDQDLYLPRRPEHGDRSGDRSGSGNG